MAPSRQADNRNVFLWFEGLASPFTWSVSRPAEVQPWEVRFAHPCRARARHPIHKAMGGHAFHGRVFITFQFRVGTIKTLWPRTPISRLLFNSIMVQLEHLRVDTVYVLMRNPQISHMLDFPLHIRVLLSIDSFHQFIWCKYLHL